MIVVNEGEGLGMYGERTNWGISLALNRKHEWLVPVALSQGSVVTNTSSTNIELISETLPCFILNPDLYMVLCTFDEWTFRDSDQLTRGHTSITPNQHWCTSSSNYKSSHLDFPLSLSGIQDFYCHRMSC